MLGRSASIIDTSGRQICLLLIARALKIACLGLFGLGILYVLFSVKVSLIASGDKLERADGLVVLTGDARRIENGIRLLKFNFAKRLLISGVHEKTTREMIARLTNEEDVFKGCCIDIDRAAKNTVGNARYSADWVAENAFDSVIVVTSDYHMPRSLILMQRAMPQVRFIPFAVRNGSKDWMSAIFRMSSPSFLREFLKYISVLSGLGSSTSFASSDSG